ncbi:LPXTG cell wall anchor domain-containing protein [Streptococcus pneumoniae]|uniref:LPXTG cell wall anchor domain-containing protein n=1 Tax=Streptococcus pneumoniae TaxID=1313 RepID=UPI0005E29A20|nr:LPXTG cell wall anchor domain-containing protein [Streptococcus pneumoniae]CJC28475.1 pneumococcal surface protein PspA [Streptococcus pneumoniae]CJL66637.1 pneumococcal surface protein PspA [Streptococcus pneumoniae]CKD41785.1 pneumococcal surface protein PspA [Streptococcus pneumoniae]
MDKKRMILASLASAAVLGAGFTTIQPLVVKADENAAKPATPKVIQDAEADAKKAEAKVTEAQTKVDTTTTAANEAATKLETEKKEAADAETAKMKAAESKTTADNELAKAKEEAKKEEDAKKEEADSKEALKEAFAKLEKEIDDDSNIKNKEVVKKLLGKEDLLAAVEAGDLKAGDVLKELENDDKTASNTVTTTAEFKAKDQLPEDIKAGIEKAEKADAARPASEKAQDKADDLAEKIEELTVVAEADKANADKKAEALKKQEDTLRETNEALTFAKENGSSSEIVDSLDKAVKAIEKERNVARNAFDEAYSPLSGYKAEIDALTDEYNKALDEVKVAKEKEANEPAKPVEEEPAKPAEKTEAEKAADAKKEADAKVSELEKKAAEEAKKVEEATAKAEKEAADVKVAETAKTAADKAKEAAEAELVKAKEAAEAAKAKVEELKKDEADSLAGLKYALDKLEKAAEDEINAKNEITDKSKAIEAAKAEIGKEALLKAIENGEISASEAARDLDDQAVTAEANKNQDPRANEIGATKQESKALSELPAADKEKLDAAYNKEASKPIVKKLTDIADDLAEKIEKLTKVANKDKADATEKAKAVEERNVALNKQKETLEKAKTALETANKNNADQDVKDKLQDAVTKLEGSVATAKAAADEAQAKFDEVNEVVKAYKAAIDELTDDYNATLEYIKDVQTTPTEPNNPEGVVTDKGEPAVQPENPEVKVTETPVEPKKDEPSKEDNDSEIEALQNKVADLEKEVAELEKLVADNENNPAAVDYVTAAKEKLEAKKAELEEAKKELEKALDVLGPEGEDTEETPTEPAKHSEDAAIEALQNKVADLEKEVAELEKLVADNENNPDAVDYVTAAKEKLEDKKAELEKAENELEEALKGLEPSNGDALVQPELPEYTGPVTPENGQRQPEGAAPTGRQGAPRQQTNPPAAPTGETPAPVHPMPAPAATPAVAGTSQDNTYQAPAAKADDKKELPNTGGKDNVAIASLGFLGLFIGALPFAKRKN